MVTNAEEAWEKFIEMDKSNICDSSNERPIVIKETIINNKVYRADPPLHFDVSYNKKASLYDLRGDFGIILCDSSRMDLEETLKEHLKFLWKEYAEESSNRLTSEANNLRDELLKRLREI